MATETTEQIVREAPEIEAIKLGLLESAKQLADKPVTIPAQQIAGLSPLQMAAFGAAEQGIGGFQPYLTEAGYTLGDAQTALGGVMAGATPYQQEAAFGLRQAAEGIPAQITASQLGMQGAIGSAQQAAERANLGTALLGQQAIPQFGESTQRGIGAYEQMLANLAGTTGQFDPASIAQYQSPYEDLAVQQALSDIARQGQLQREQLGAQAVGAGAFGGSRQAVAEQELGRNVLEQQARTAAQMRSAGFQNASQMAQQAFEAQQARGQQAAQLGGQMGLSTAQIQAANAQALAQTGLNIEQLASQTGLSAAQLAGPIIWSSRSVRCFWSTVTEPDFSRSWWLGNRLRSTWATTRRGFGNAWITTSFAWSTATAVGTARGRFLVRHWSEAATTATGRTRSCKTDSTTSGLRAISAIGLSCPIFTKVLHLLRWLLQRALHQKPQLEKRFLGWVSQVFRQPPEQVKRGYFNE